MSPHVKGVFLTIFAAIVWSTGGLLVKLITLDAFTILFYRSLYAGLFFLLVFRKQAIHLDRRVLLIAVCYAPLLICFVTATKLTTAANAIFLQYISPAIVLVLEPRILNQKIKAHNLLTVLVCTIGLSFFLLNQGKGHSWIGDGLALLSGFFSAFLILSLRFSNQTQQMSGIFFGNVLVVLITLFWFLKSPAPTLPEHGMLIFLGVIQIGLGYLLFTYGQRCISAIESSLIAMLEPILNPIWVMIGYNEFPSGWSIAGGLTIIVALTIHIIFFTAYSKSPPVKYKAG
ncbi:MAG: DMT family transporter [Bacteroidota bacterium]|nr:DMT family transporter [Bacteroidota bacterium]